jgi:hypothetical protein
MKHPLILAFMFVLTSCARQENESRIITVRCEGISHYTGLIGTERQFTESEFVKDFQYVFDLKKKKSLLICLA